jgi:hypothetical protein
MIAPSSWNGEHPIQVPVTTLRQDDSKGVLGGFRDCIASGVAQAIQLSIEFLSERRRLYFTMVVGGLLIAGIMATVTLVMLNRSVQKPDISDAILNTVIDKNKNGRVTQTDLEKGLWQALLDAPLKSKIAFGLAAFFCGVFSLIFINGAVNNRAVFMHRLKCSLLALNPYGSYQVLKSPLGFAAICCFLAAAVSHIAGIVFLGAMSNLALSLIFSSLFFALGFLIWLLSGFYVELQSHQKKTPPLKVTIVFLICAYVPFSLFMGACGSIGGTIGIVGAVIMVVACVTSTFRLVIDNQARLMRPRWYAFFAFSALAIVSSLIAVCLGPGGTFGFVPFVLALLGSISFSIPSVLWYCKNESGRSTT